MGKDLARAAPSAPFFSARTSQLSTRQTQNGNHETQGEGGVRLPWLATPLHPNRCFPLLFADLRALFDSHFLSRVPLLAVCEVIEIFQSGLEDPCYTTRFRDRGRIDCAWRSILPPGYEHLLRSITIVTFCSVVLWPSNMNTISTAGLIFSARPHRKRPSVVGSCK